MNIRIMLAGLVLALAACVQPPTAPPAVQPEAVTKVEWQGAANAEQCSTLGGEWRPICMMGKPACVVTYKDAGKNCSNSSECSGRCVVSGAGAKPDAATKGICTSNSDPCGCFQLVSKGIAGFPLCAD